MTGKGSILDPILTAFGITYNDPWVIGVPSAYLILLLVNIFLVSYVVFYVYTNRMIRKKPLDDFGESPKRGWRNGR